jgi:hypothetical protein
MIESTDEAVVLTIERFCKRNLISPTHYFELRARGQGPREMRLGASVRISLEAEQDWQHARETPDEDQMARLRERGRKGAKGRVR